MKPSTPATVESPQLTANNNAAISIANRLYGRKFEREPIWADEFIKPETWIVVRTRSAEGNGPLMAVEREGTAPEKLAEYLAKQSYNSGSVNKYTTVAVPGLSGSEAVISYMDTIAVTLNSTLWKIDVVGPVTGQPDEMLQELARELLAWADRQPWGDTPVEGRAR